MVGVQRGQQVRPGDGARALQSARPPGVPLLLTTRDEELALALGAKVRRLDVLPLEKALELLAALAGPAVEREPDAARSLAERVGCLPLALELAGKLAALHARKPGWQLASLCTQVKARAAETLRLKGQRGLAACFSLSYETLDAEEQRLFRALGVFAPAPFAAGRVAAVLGWEAGTTEARLDALVALSLARWETKEGEGLRYNLHPLLRDYAIDLLDQTGERPAAGAAHTAHYLAYAEAHEQPTAAGYDALEAEQPNILAAMERTYRDEGWAQVRRFMWALDNYLDVRGYWSQYRTRLEQAVRAAEAEGHQRDAAAFTVNLAELMRKTGDLTAAHQSYQRVLAIFEELGERESVAVAYHQLGLLAQARGQPAEADRLYRQSLAIKEELGDRADIAITLHQLGRLAQARGQPAEAERLYRQSLAIAEELENRAGIAISLGQLANLADDRGDPAEAEQLYRQAIALGEEVGDVVGMSIGMFNLALLCEQQKRLEEALPLLERAVGIFERVGSPHAETVRPVLDRVRGKLKL